MTPLSKGQIREVFSGKETTLTRGVARGVVQHQKEFKRQSLPDQVLPDFRDKTSDGTSPEKRGLVQASLLYDQSGLGGAPRCR